jgi:hypothetical protein
MEKRCDVTIRECANGYIVDQRDGSVDPAKMAANKLVFRDWESLTAWLAVHFSRAEWVGGALSGGTWPDLKIGGLNTASFLTPEQVNGRRDPIASNTRDWSL